jgi:hypothetical protein
MYQYFFDGDTVRLAYWRIDYDENKFRYANSDSEKDAILVSLKSLGYTPTAEAINQSGNEWIDGMCFADHDSVEAALKAGRKNFICKRDSEDIANTLTIMNDAAFSVDANGIWNITAPGTPSIPCYGVMTCITTNSVDNQKVSINGAAAIPLMKAVGSPIMANELRASADKPLAIQINVTETVAFMNVSVGDGWGVGEVKHFAYKRPSVASELYCDGTAYSKERYPLLYETMFDTYAVPPDSILRTSTSARCIVAFGNGVFVRTSPLAYSTDGATWTPISIGIGTPVYVSFANGMFVLLAYTSRAGSGSTSYSVATSVDGVAWSNKSWAYSTSTDFTANIYLAYAAETSEWAIVFNPDDNDYNASILYSVDNFNSYTKVNAPCTFVHAICPVSGGWLIIYDKSVYFASSISSGFALAYTIESANVTAQVHETSIGSPSTQAINQTTHIDGKCFAVFNGYLCVFDKDGYTACHTKLNIGSGSVMSVVNELADKSSIMIITPKVICAATPDGDIKMPVEHTITYGSSNNIHYGAYGVVSSAYGNNTIVFTTYNGTYSLDVTNFALPNQINANTYDYIKAE